MTPHSNSAFAPIVILAIDDDPATLQLVQEALGKEGRSILTAEDPEEGLNMIFRHRPQILLVDLTMPKMTGIEVLDRALGINPELKVILMTGNYSTESAVDAIRRGAFDYLEKPLSLQKLQSRIDLLVNEATKLQRAEELESQLADFAQFEGIVGRCTTMLGVFDRIRRVAPHFRTILVTGQTGTGKELVARALHRLSSASSGPFVVCNSSAIVETLFESELFGHVKGAFTGATQDRIGFFEHAHGGTLFLDEIGDLPLATQAKLLRVLQNQEVQRVGSPAARKVDVRVIAATNRNLVKLVADKGFREDLFYRISAVEIHLPRLVERREDLPLLIRHLIGKYAREYRKTIRGLSQRAEGLLMAHAWPGNVRELENVLSYACMICESEAIDVKDFPETLRRPQFTAAPDGDDLLPLEEIERRHIHRVLERVGGNKKQAIEILGIGRTTLYRFLKQDENQPEEDETASESDESQ